MEQCGIVTWDGKQSMRYQTSWTTWALVVYQFIPWCFKHFNKNGIVVDRSRPRINSPLPPRGSFGIESSKFEAESFGDSELGNQLPEQIIDTKRPLLSRDKVVSLAKLFKTFLSNRLFIRNWLVICLHYSNTFSCSFRTWWPQMPGWTRKARSVQLWEGSCSRLRWSSNIGDWIMVSQMGFRSKLTCSEIIRSFNV